MSTFPPKGVRLSVARGATFTSRDPPSLHTLRYAFKPESVARASSGRLRFAARGAVELRVATEAKEVVFNGNTEDHKSTEFALICDSDGSWRLEKLSKNIKNMTVSREAAPRVPPPRRSPPRAARHTASASGAAALGEATEDADVDAHDLFGID